MDNICLVFDHQVDIQSLIHILELDELSGLLNIIFDYIIIIDKIYTCHQKFVLNEDQQQLLENLS